MRRDRRRSAHSGRRQIALDLFAAAERCRSLELRHGLGTLAQGQLDPTEQLVGARPCRVRSAALPEPSEKVGVRHAGLDPCPDAHVVGGLDVLGFGLEGAAPQRVRFGRPPEVHERDGAVVERVRRAPTTLHLPPRVGPPRSDSQAATQPGHHLDEVAGPILGSFLEAAGQDVRHASGIAGRPPPRGRLVDSPPAPRAPQGRTPRCAPRGTPRARRGRRPTGRSDGRGPARRRARARGRPGYRPRRPRPSPSVRRHRPPPRGPRPRTERARASPKSVTFARPSEVSITFAGLTSRWTSPCACA